MSQNSLQNNSIAYIEEVIRKEELRILELQKKLEVEIISVSSYDALVQKLQELTADNKQHSFSIYIEGETIELREEPLN